MIKKIGIITINYNNRNGLEKTILSVINQKNVDFEFIIIDGNSTDGSKEIIEKYKDKFTFSISESDSGIYNAMNKGISNANSDYLLFMNSGDCLIDDELILKKCESLLSEDIVAFDCFLERSGKIVGKRTHVGKPSFFYVYKNGFKHQSTFIKKNLFDNLGNYNEIYKIAADYEFWIRCFLDPKTTVKCYNFPMAIFELGGISQNSDWFSEHKIIEKKLLTNLMPDFLLMEELQHYQKFIIFKRILDFKFWIKKVIKNSK